MKTQIQMKFEKMRAHRAPSSWLLLLAVAAGAYGSGCGQSKMDFNRNQTTVENRSSSSSPTPDAGPAQPPSTTPDSQSGTGTTPGTDTTTTQPTRRVLEAGEEIGLHFKSNDRCAVDAMDKMITGDFDLLRRNVTLPTPLASCQRRVNPSRAFPNITRNLEMTRSDGTRVSLNTNAMFRDTAFVRLAFNGDATQVISPLRDNLAYRDLSVAGDVRFGTGSAFYDLFQADTPLISLLDPEKACDFLNSYEEMVFTMREIYRLLLDGQEYLANPGQNEGPGRVSRFTQLNSTYLARLGRVTELLNGIINDTCAVGVLVSNQRSLMCQAPSGDVLTHGSNNQAYSPRMPLADFKQKMNAVLARIQSLQLGSAQRISLNFGQNLLDQGCTPVERPVVTTTPYNPFTSK